MMTRTTSPAPGLQRRVRAAPRLAVQPACTARVKRSRVVPPLRAAAGSRRRHGTGTAVAGPSDDIRFHIDRDGRQHFNFEQRIWLDPLVPMACTRVPSTALTTLAVNLLTLVMRTRDYRAAIGTGSRQAVLLAQDFSDECLLPAPEQAWVMPRAAIRAWIESHRRGRGAGRTR